MPSAAYQNESEKTKALRKRIELAKESASDFQRRRHSDWTENYQLFRDKVITNRLTQRQSVNIPITKETVGTILSKVDDPPNILYEERANDKQKEIYINEWFKEDYDFNKMKLLDLIDKKQNCLYGRTFYKFNIVDGRIKVTVEDPMDILVDRFTNPADIETAQYIIKINMFRAYDEIVNDERYTAEGKKDIKERYSKVTTGVQNDDSNSAQWTDKNQRMQNMGDGGVNFPNTGTPLIEINEVYIKEWDTEEEEMMIRYVVMAYDVILLNKPLKEVMGINFYPFVSWASDVEALDFWSDGVVDIVRPVNKVLNVWASQMIENRTLRNMGMQYYNSMNEDFNPDTYQPMPFGWYPVPGNPSEMIQRVEIPDLSSTLQEMQFFIQTVERSTASTATIKGVKEAGAVTLGQIQIMQQSAMERITSMSLLYKQMYKDFGEKWLALTLANEDKLDGKTLYKKGTTGIILPKELEIEDFISKSGYDVVISSSNEQEQKNFAQLQKYKAVKQEMPSNPILDREYKKKLVDVLGVPQEVEREILSFEDQQRNQAEQGQTAMAPVGGMPMAGQPGQGMPPQGAPQPTILDQANQKVASKLTSNAATVTA
jgi:hypothetical protein